MKRLISRIVFVVAALFVSSARAQMVLFDGTRVAAILHDTHDDPAIATAADPLARDLTALTGQTPARNTHSGPAIIIGVQTAPMMSFLLHTNDVDTRPL